MIPAAFALDEPSKSRIKRDFKAVTNMGARLVALSDAQLMHLPYADLIAAIAVYRKIRKGNAKKRQLQFIGKLLRKVDLADVQRVLDRFDASSPGHHTHFHLIEGWRDRLLKQEQTIMAEILATLPHINRQRLRQLSRNAVNERARMAAPGNESLSPVHFRRLFKFLKEAAASFPE